MALNHFNFSKKLSDNPFGLEEAEIILTSETAPFWMPALNQFYEIPILQGEKKIDPEGTVSLKFKLSSEEASIFKKALMDAYTKHSGFQTSN